MTKMYISVMFSKHLQNWSFTSLSIYAEYYFARLQLLKIKQMYFQRIESKDYSFALLVKKVISTSTDYIHKSRAYWNVLAKYWLIEVIHFNLNCNKRMAKEPKVITATTSRKFIGYFICLQRSLTPFTRGKNFE